MSLSKRGPSHSILVGVGKRSSHDWSERIPSINVSHQGLPVQGQTTRSFGNQSFHFVVTVLITTDTTISDIHSRD
jgi:hypothetical protein